MNWKQKIAARCDGMRTSTVRELLKLANNPGMISFAGGLPAPDLLPTRELAEAAARALSKSPREALQYGPTEGLSLLREWIAARTGLHLENILITSGAQQALDLIGRVLLNAGDVVAVENPTYLALLSAWRPLDVAFIPVESDSDGMVIERLSQSTRKPKLVYTIPNFQNPQGTTLSLDRRRALAEFAEAKDVIIVEDDPYAELHYEGGRLPTLLSMNPATIHVGSFSKSVSPGLRLGWIAAEGEVIEKLVLAKQSMDLNTGMMAQLALMEFLSQGSFETHLARLREGYLQRRDAMLAEMSRCFPASAQWSRPAGGFFVFVSLPAAIDSSKVLARVIPRAVSFVPGAEFHLGEMGRNTMRMNFSHPSPLQIKAGIQILGELLAEESPEAFRSDKACTPAQLSAA